MTIFDMCWICWEMRRKCFRLKEGIDFHLFITTAPCGDARIFSLHEATLINKATTCKAEATEASLDNSIILKEGSR